MINFADRDQLFTALSCWLQMPCVDADHQPDPSTSAPFPVPMVYSHEHWFDISLLPLSAQVGAEMDADACAVGRLSRILSQLRELISRVPQCYCSRERMGEFLEAFVQLIRCAEKPAQDYCRRLAQCSLMALLDRFEPIGQFLLLSHLFGMVFGRKITLSEEVREPQVLGMLIDIYRQNCFSHSNVECRKVFHSQLGHFYGQLKEVVYDDPFIAVNFYTALLLLISAQALHRVRPQLLKTIGQPVIEKVRNQFSDWMRLREQKQKSATDEQSEKKKPRKEGIEHSLEEMSKQREDELAKTVPEIFYFQLSESERNVAQALQFFAAD